MGTQEKISGIEKEAYEKSFAQGEKDGFEFGEKKAIKIIENIENIFNEIASLKHDVLKQQEREIIDLIFAVAEKIVHHEVRSKESVIKNAILDALKLAVEKSKVVFNVNPDDYDYVEKLRPEIFNQNKGLKSIIVTSDPGVSRGGCYLETPYGNIDATIESKLEKIYQCLQESVE
ncbi:MAG: FliH/SctL family protein [Desulfobacteraceae bacterium]|nr:FliH/SctL family protein [Desulfobacteraceae bacterium]